MREMLGMFKRCNCGSLMCHAHHTCCSVGKAWKRMVTKVCFVGEGFTRKPPKYERFIRPMVGWCLTLSTRCRYIRTPYSCIKFALLMDYYIHCWGQSDSHLTFDCTLPITSYPMVACCIPLHLPSDYPPHSTPVSTSL